MYGIRALPMLTSLHSLRHGRCLTRVFPSCTFRGFRKFSKASWSSPKILKQSKPSRICSFLRPSVVHFFSQPYLSKDDAKINEVILSLQTVKEQLELFGSIKNSAETVDKVTMLQRIAKISERDENQRRVLEQEKGKSRQAFNSAYLELLDSISEDITKCQPTYLYAVMEALGKLGERDHELAQLCQKAILSHGITTFDDLQIEKIVNACFDLHLPASEIFSTLQESIRKGQLKLSNFEIRFLFAMLQFIPFGMPNACAVELCNIFLEDILSRDFSLMDSSYLAFFVWLFPRKKLKVGALFDRVEEEILRRGAANFEITDVVDILSAYSQALTGSKQFFDIMGNELALRGLEGLKRSDVVRIVWPFATRDATNAKVFDLVRDEIFKRGVGMFEVIELVHILHSFAFARRYDNRLVEGIESELLTRDVEQFDNDLLCQVAWSLGRARKSDSKMFDVIEEVVLQRDMHQFSISVKFLLLQGYIDAKRGSRKLYEGLQASFCTSRFADFTAGDIFVLAWRFADIEENTGPLINTGQLFDTLEREILTRGKYSFREMELLGIKRSFRKVGKGTNDLFQL